MSIDTKIALWSEHSQNVTNKQIFFMLVALHGNYEYEEFLMHFFISLACNFNSIYATHSSVDRALALFNYFFFFGFIIINRYLWKHPQYAFQMWSSSSFFLWSFWISIHNFLLINFQQFFPTIFRCKIFLF